MLLKIKVSREFFLNYNCLKRAKKNFPKLRFYSVSSSNRRLNINNLLSTSSHIHHGLLKSIGNLKLPVSHFLHHFFLKFLRMFLFVISLFKRNIKFIDRFSIISVFLRNILITSVLSNTKVLVNIKTF